MTESPVHYGVRKLIAINSGKYRYAELDLSASVHLAAPNNRGKSTLVNALQFLYVDELRHMRFGSRSLDDTRRHYFGQNPSYLVFECVTPLGPKCLLVAGQGPLNNCHFSRFVFEGPFEHDLFRDADKNLLALDQLRRQLAGHGLAEVRPGNLWEVLGSPQTSSNNGSLPRLNILPVRNREEYRSFRAAFIRLLALSNVSARELRELLITCHARDITCQRIDVAAEHREEFDRAEQAERTLAFTKAIQAEVEKGRVLRENIMALTQRLQAEAPPVADELAAVNRLLAGVHTSIDTEQASLTSRAATLDSRRSKLNQQLGRLRVERQKAQQAWDELQQLHDQWSGCTDQMIQTMRGNIDALNDRITQLRQNLEQAGRRSVDTLRRRVGALKQDLQRKQRALENWGTRVVNGLRESGFTNEQLNDIFKLLNPHLLDLSVGTDVHIHDPASLNRQLKALQQAIDDGRYHNGSVEIDLAQLVGPALGQQGDRSELQDDVEVTEKELARARDQLEVAENQAQATKKLNEQIDERERLSQQLQEYDQYAARWADRDALNEQRQALEKRIAKVQDRIEDLARQSQDLAAQEQALKDTLVASNQARQDLTRAASDYHQLQEEARLAAPLAQAEPEGVQARRPPVKWSDVEPRFTKLRERLEQMQSSAQSVRRMHTQLTGVEKNIRDQSRQFEGQAVYFSDADADWERLIQLVESLGEQEEVVEQAWSSLFTRVAAKLNEIKQGVAEIRTAVHRISRGLAAYRVSNLRSVKLEVVVKNETFDLIDTLTSEGGIFQDHEKIDRAKDQMRQWIRDGRVIQLDELFGVHIKVHDLDREHPTEAKSLDEIGSTGTGMTAKAMVFIQLVRAVVSQERYRLHFYLDETGQLDERNLAATTRMAVDKGVMPITADPNVRIEPLAHPTVTVYSLGQDESGRFFIDGRRTCRGRRAHSEAATGSNP